MRSRAKTLLLAALASLLMSALLAPAANGARYVAKRAEFRIFLRTEGHRVAELRMHFRLSCDDGSRRGWSTRHSEFNRLIDRRTGRFTFRYQNATELVSFKQRMVGNVTEKRIRGRFTQKLFDRGAICWTGRSQRDPWIHFVAQRQRGSPPGHGRG